MNGTGHPHEDPVARQKHRFFARQTQILGSGITHQFVQQICESPLLLRDDGELSRLRSNQNLIRITRREISASEGNVSF